MNDNIKEMQDKVENEIKKGFDKKRVKNVWDEFDGMYRKYMWNNYVKMWVEV